MPAGHGEVVSHKPQANAPRRRIPSAQSAPPAALPGRGGTDETSARVQQVGQRASPSFRPSHHRLRRRSPPPYRGSSGRARRAWRWGCAPGARDEISLCSVNPYSFKVSSGRPLKGGEGQPRAGEGVPTNRNHPQCCFASAHHLPRPRPPVFWARADGPPPAGTAHFFFRTKKFSRKPVLCRFLPHASQSA